MNTVRTISVMLIVNLIIVLVACQSEIEVPTQMPSEIPASLPTPSLIPSATATVDLMEKAHINETCPCFRSFIPLDIELRGIVVLDKSRDPQLGIGDAYLLNLNNNDFKKIYLQDEYAFSYAVSIDRKVLAYGIGSRDMHFQIVISDSGGNRLKVIPRDNDFWIRGWLNDQLLFVYPSVLNLYTGEEKSYDPQDFPDYSPTSIWTKWFDLDPKLTRIMYAGNGGIALVDLQTKQILTTVPDNIDGTIYVAWTSDSLRVAVVGTTTRDNGITPVAEEIYVVTRDGQSKQMTHLSDYYGNTYSLYYLSWSPDDRYIAFWQKDVSAGNPEWRLLVLDTETEKVTSYCALGNSVSNIFRGPIWSPDGKQLLIENQDTKGVNRAVIIDIEKNIAFPIADDARPVGWMVSP